MRATADSQGKVAIVLTSPGGESLSFRVGAVNGVPLMPNAEVEIPDEALAAVIAAATEPFVGLGPWVVADGD